MPGDNLGSKLKGLLRRFFDKVYQDVLDEDKPVPVEKSQDSEIESDEHPTTKTQTINPNNLTDKPSKTKFLNKNKAPEEEASEHETPWWEHPGNEMFDAPVFEILQDDRVAEELNRKIDDDEFPVIEIPGNVMKAMEILNKSDFEYNEVADLIRHSPAMTGEFIKSFNSALFFRGETISDLKVGLPRLGKDNIKAMLYMYSSRMSFSKDVLFNDLAKNIVDHCYAVALIASHLAQIYYPNPDEAFLAGLLHDIGKLGILRALNETYELPEEIDFELTEEVFDDIFPGLHERAGGFLAKNWKIDNEVIFSIEHHHDLMEQDFDPEDQAHRLSALVNLSDTIARILGRGRGIAKVDVFEEPSAEALSIIKDYDTIKYLENIPGLLATQSAEA
jgi:putative nucleotidyltransferase with HDIG domain